ADGGTVVEARGVSSRHPPVWAEGRLERREALHRRIRTWCFVARGQAPAFGRLDGDRHQVRIDLAGLDGSRKLLLAGERIAVGALLREGGEAVVNLFRRVSHIERVRVDELLRNEARV